MWGSSTLSRRVVILGRLLALPGFANAGCHPGPPAERREEAWADVG